MCRPESSKPSLATKWAMCHAAISTQVLLLFNRQSYDEFWLFNKSFYNTTFEEMAEDNKDQSVAVVEEQQHSKTTIPVECLISFAKSADTALHRIDSCL